MENNKENDRQVEETMPMPWEKQDKPSSQYKWSKIFKKDEIQRKIKNEDMHVGAGHTDLSARMRRIGYMRAAKNPQIIFGTSADGQGQRWAKKVHVAWYSIDRSGRESTCCIVHRSWQEPPESRNASCLSMVNTTVFSFPWHLSIPSINLFGCVPALWGYVNDHVRIYCLSFKS